MTEKRTGARPLVPYKCKRPGCTNTGKGYKGKKACSPTCRNWLWRQEQARRGRIRTHNGYYEGPPINDGMYGDRCVAGVKVYDNRRIAGIKLDRRVA